MKKVKPELWQPADGLILEPNALNIAKSSENNLVVAGPGAGKTELLAQKATYLLQTNTCPFPFKILAISFKRDAAYNLKERVRLRCGDDLSRRFDSLTFDSFAKQILDRFKQALPNEFKVSNEYEIVPDSIILDHYLALNLSLKKVPPYHNAKLPHSQDDDAQKIKEKVWKRMLEATPSQLSFGMIMRLAEHIINTNPRIKQYLQQTYKYVFLDEFQDTTGKQYDFFKSCFIDSGSFFTAVGDDKQRIMLWAGAQVTVFEDFIADTGATRVPLTMNFRSAPRLVGLFNHLTLHLLGKTDFVIPSPKWQSEQGECAVWEFENPTDEKQLLFQEVNNWVMTDRLNPRDICILVKQQLSQYAGDLIEYFNNNGIKTRDESLFQDVLTDDIMIYIINAMYAIFDEKDSIAKLTVFNFLSHLYTDLSDENQMLRLEIRLSKFIKNIRNKYLVNSLSEDSIGIIINEILNLADKDRICATFHGYSDLAFLEMNIDHIKNMLINEFMSSSSMIAALDRLVGKDTIPVMTIHKSKGLEYHTVIFVGLEDGAFWSFQQQPDEDKCAFFVALSRAKERVILTFSKQREGRFGLKDQTRKNISVFFDQMEKSGIVNIVEKKC